MDTVLKTTPADILADIGTDLDRGIYPSIHDGGIVQPGNSHVVTTKTGEEKENAIKPSRGSATGSWKWTKGRAWETSQSRTSSKASSVQQPGSDKNWVTEIEALSQHYPDTRYWVVDEGVWLLTRSAIVSGLGRTASFLTALPFVGHSYIRTWGFWTTQLSREWIGPRHTNFPDGSVCAYEHRDGTWQVGDPLVSLIDLYTLWALRHEYLRRYGRWPGYQSVSFAYERLDEFRPGEFCGCGHSMALYENCCKQYDEKRSRISSLVELYVKTSSNLIRKPPQPILDFMGYRQRIPSYIRV